MKQRFADQRVMPVASATLFRLQRIDPLAPGGGCLQLALHVRMADLLLRLGFHQVDRVSRAHQKVRDVQRRQAILLDVAQPHEVVAVLADLAERFHAGIGLRPFDEGALQAAAKGDRTHRVALDAGGSATGR